MSNLQLGTEGAGVERRAGAGKWPGSRDVPWLEASSSSYKRRETERPRLKFQLSHLLAGWSWAKLGHLSEPQCPHL